MVSNENASETQTNHRHFSQEARKLASGRGQQERRCVG